MALLYEPCSKVVINGKTRILYMKKNKKTKYIKSKGKYIKFSDYKKRYKVKGGERGPYIDTDLDNIAHGFIYSYRRNEYPTDPITNKYIKKNKAILVNGWIYNINSIYKYILQGNNSDPKTPQIPIGIDNKRRIFAKYTELYGDDDLPPPSKQSMFQTSPRTSKLISSFQRVSL